MAPSRKRNPVVKAEPMRKPAPTKEVESDDEIEADVGGEDVAADESVSFHYSPPHAPTHHTTTALTNWPCCSPPHR